MTLHHFSQGKTVIIALLFTLSRELGLKKNLLRHTILIQTLSSKHSMQNIHYKIAAIASIWSPLNCIHQKYIRHHFIGFLKFKCWLVQAVTMNDDKNISICQTVTFLMYTSFQRLSHCKHSIPVWIYFFIATSSASNHWKQHGDAEFYIVNKDNTFHQVSICILGSHFLLHFLQHISLF